MNFGRKFLCHNHGPFYMREIVGCEQLLYTDDSLAQVLKPDHIIRRGWAYDRLISPDAAPSEA